MFWYSPRHYFSWDARSRVVIICSQQSWQNIWCRLFHPEYYPSNIITSNTLVDLSGHSKSLTAFGIYSLVPCQVLECSIDLLKCAVREKHLCSINRYSHNMKRIDQKMKFDNVQEFKKSWVRLTTPLFWSLIKYISKNKSTNLIPGFSSSQK